jgi:hypothetical protein
MNSRRALIWVPRGPVGVALFFLLLALGIAAAVALSIVLLAVAAVGVVGLGVYGVGRTLLSDTRERLTGPRADGPEVEVLAGPERADEIYLRGVEEFDHLVTALLRVDAEQHDGWRQRRQLRRAAERIERLRAGLERAERTLATGNGPEAIRPGLWELLVASQELERYFDALLGFPRSRVLREQIAELERLQQQAAALDRRRDALLLRLRATDLRGERA